LLELFDERLDTNTIKSSGGRVTLLTAFVGVDRGDVGGVYGMKEVGEGVTIEFFHLEKSGGTTDAVECVDTISEVFIIIRMGLHDGVDGVDNGFSTTR
jgi:hypothetical protein